MPPMETMSGYTPSWQDRIVADGAYPHNPAAYPEYGLSTYNIFQMGAASVMPRAKGHFLIFVRAT